MIKELVSLIDVPPTLLTCAGIEVPDYMRGRPVQQLLEGKVEDWPQEVFLQISESHVGRAIRTKRWKYSVKAVDKDGWNDMGSDVYMEDCLYDLEKDPYEKNNLVADPGYTKVRSQLAERLKERMNQAGEDIPELIPYKMA